MKSLQRLAMIGVLVLTSTAACAQDDMTEESAAPAIQKEIPLLDTSRTAHKFDEVKFVTGGVGEDERREIEAARGAYNLHITSAGVGGEFVDNARVIIRDAAGEEALDVEAGPLLYVVLPAGKYTLEATLGEQVKQQKFTITAKTKDARVHLGWKAQGKAE